MERRKNSTAQFRLRMMGLFQSSGLSVRDFAAKHSINKSTLTLWMRQYRSALSSDFVPVKIQAEVVRSSVTPFARLHLKSGEVFEIPLCADPHWVARVVGVTQ